MSKKQETTDADMLRAAWDILGDVTLVHNIQVGGLWLPTTRRGVWEFRLRAYRPTPNGRPTQVAAYQLEWPNSQNLSLGGALFRCANQLDHLMVSQGRGERIDEASA